MREKAIKIKRKRCASDWFLDIFKVVFLVLVTVICVYPFWNIFVVSINDATDALRGEALLSAEKTESGKL